VGQRAAIVLAGPVANFILAIVLLSGLYIAIGKPSPESVIGDVFPDSAAAAAGLQAGDRIIEINGQHTTSFDDVVAFVKGAQDGPLKIVVERDGQRQEMTARLAPPGAETQGKLGITSSSVAVDPLSAVRDAVSETWRLTGAILTAVGEIISGERPAKELGGVLSIAKVSGDVARIGISSLISFAAVLSINLGLINLFPIPMLDGGHLAFYAVEAARGRPLGARAQEWGLRLGFALVIGLMLFATWNDLVNLKVLAYLKNLVT
jgi:regulator of sigma E protease